jgi:hypothetical protein
MTYILQVAAELVLSLVCCLCVILCRLSKASKAMQQQQELYEYLSNGPPDQPAFDAEADAAEAVQQLLQGDLVITTYDVLQQVWHIDCCVLSCAVCVVVPGNRFLMLGDMAMSGHVYGVCGKGRQLAHARKVRCRRMINIITATDHKKLSHAY